jgi:hypothetical protein
MPAAALKRSSSSSRSQRGIHATSDREDAAVVREVDTEDVRHILLVFWLSAAEQGHDVRSLRL